MERLRVCAYNVKGFGAGPEVVAAAIADERPDVVFVNEAGGRRRLARFARVLGMEQVSGLRWFRGIPNGITVRPPLTIAGSRVVPFTRTGRLHRRGAVIADVTGPSAGFWCAGVHLGLSKAERNVHAVQLIQAIGTSSSPGLVGGDLNEFPGEPATRTLTERFQDAFAVRGEGPGDTYPAHAPRARIDYVFAGHGFRVERAWVLRTPLTEPASDHLPVFADVVPG